MSERTMIERVAIAMRKELGLDWPYTGHGTLMDVARAAVVAMREPTDSMIIAGAKAMTDANNAIACDEGEWLAGEFALDARRGFPAMIDAALAEND